MAAQKSMMIVGVTVVLLSAVVLARAADCDKVGVTCHDCRSRLVCTPFGGIVTPCWLPGYRFCSNGRCVKEPTQECSPTTTSTTPTTESTSTSEEPTSTSELPTEGSFTDASPTTEELSTTDESTYSTTEELSSSTSFPSEIGISPTTEELSSSTDASPTTGSVIPTTEDLSFTDV